MSRMVRPTATIPGGGGTGGTGGGQGPTYPPGPPRRGKNWRKGQKDRPKPYPSPTPGNNTSGSSNSNSRGGSRGGSRGQSGGSSRGGRGGHGGGSSSSNTAPGNSQTAPADSTTAPADAPADTPAGNDKTNSGFGTSRESRNLPGVPESHPSNFYDDDDEEDFAARHRPPRPPLGVSPDAPPSGGFQTYPSVEATGMIDPYPPVPMPPLYNAGTAPWQPDAFTDPGMTVPQAPLYAPSQTSETDAPGELVTPEKLKRADQAPTSQPASPAPGQGAPPRKPRRPAPKKGRRAAGKKKRKLRHGLARSRLCDRMLAYQEVPSARSGVWSVSGEEEVMESEEDEVVMRKFVSPAEVVAAANKKASS